ncbi:hypothetical protein B7463_g11854, partial [Scytalidium lignicola]
MIIYFAQPLQVHFLTSQGQFLSFPPHLHCAHDCLYRGLRTRDASTITGSTRTLVHVTTAAVSSLLRAGNGLDVAFGVVLAATLARGARADSGVTAAVADGSLGAFDFTASFGMDVLDSTEGLGVEVDELMTSRDTSRLLVVIVSTALNARSDDMFQVEASWVPLELWADHLETGTSSLRPCDPV